MKKNTVIVVAVAVAIIIIVIIAGSFATRRPAPLKSPTRPPIVATFSCNQGKTIKAVFYPGEPQLPVNPNEPPIPGGSVSVVLSDGRSMTLAQTISADGGRYANADESFVFWNKGNGALVLENGKEVNYTGCIVVAPLPMGSDLYQTYSNGADGFSIRTPDGYTVDSSYQYQMDPKTIINGVKFTIPSAVADGTNLGHDTYLSVENLPQAQDCNATLFLYDKKSAIEQSENGVTYSVASSTGAGVGNRYEETVYAIPGTNPCRAIRYFVHYSIIENYPPGTVKEFDKQALLSQFDAIRNTLILN